MEPIAEKMDKPSCLRLSQIIFFPFEREAVERRRVESTHGLEIVLPTPEDLIIFKSISHRPVDIEDIKAILARHPNLDDKRILSTVREFADILEMPDLYQNIESLLK